MYTESPTEARGLYHRAGPQIGSPWLHASISGSASTTGNLALAEPERQLPSSHTFPISGLTFSPLGLLQSCLPLLPFLSSNPKVSPAVWAVLAGAFPTGLWESQSPDKQEAEPPTRRNGWCGEAIVDKWMHFQGTGLLEAMVAVCSPGGGMASLGLCPL